jgi:hypothetical protein
MEAAGCSDMLIPIHQTAWHHTPEDLRKEFINLLTLICHHVQNLTALKTELCNAYSLKYKAQQMAAQFTSQSKVLLTMTSLRMTSHTLPRQYN